MFKVVREGIIVDVIKELEWVTFRPDKQIAIRTNEQYGVGIISSDGSTIFHLAGKPNILPEEYSSVSLIEITDEEALELQAILEANEQELIEQLQEELGVEEVPEEQILPRAPLMELQARVEQLTRRLEALEEENQRLREQE